MIGLINNINHDFIELRHELCGMQNNVDNSEVINQLINCVHKQTILIILMNNIIKKIESNRNIESLNMMDYFEKRIDILEKKGN